MFGQSEYEGCLFTTNHLNTDVLRMINYVLTSFHVMHAHTLANSSRWNFWDSEIETVTEMLRRSESTWSSTRILSLNSTIIACPSLPYSKVGSANQLNARVSVRLPAPSLRSRLFSSCWLQKHSNGWLLEPGCSAGAASTSTAIVSLTWLVCHPLRSVRREVKWTGDGTSRLGLLYPIRLL